MTDTQERLYTADDLLQMPDTDKRYELIKGVLLEMSPTNEVHGVLAQELAGLIWSYVRTHKLGRVYAAETGFTLSTQPDTVLAPDIAFVSAKRAKPLAEKFSTVSPDLAVEVVSPGNSAGEMNEKTALYFQAGTQQVWIVYPKTQTVHLYTSATSVAILTRQDTLEGASVLPGFKLPLDALFSVLET
jgi:Uma2 family endonuclease